MNPDQLYRYVHAFHPDILEGRQDRRIVLKMSDDAMEPTLPQGSPVIIEPGDPGHRTKRNVYLIRIREEGGEDWLRIRRLARLSEHVSMMLHDNPDCEPVLLQGEPGGEYWDILGVVINIPTINQIEES